MKKLRKVCYVLRAFPAPSETFIAEEALSLRSLGVQPHFICLKPSTGSVIHPAAQALLEARGDFLWLHDLSRWKMLMAVAGFLITSPVRTFNSLLRALNSEHRWVYFQSILAAAWCRRKGIEYLHAHFADMNAVNAREISELTRIPYGLTMHGYDIRDDPIGKAAGQAVVTGAAALVTVSEFSKQSIMAKHGLPSSAVHVVHCGVDLDRFAYAPRSRPQCFSPPRLVNVGRLVPIKGQDILIAALRLLKDSGAVCTLELVGDGPAEASLRRMADELGLADRITFHGARTQGFVRDCIHAADLFVLPSRSEGLPVACIEAMAVGTPVIATCIAGIPELITDGVEGFLVPSEDSHALARAIAAALGDEGRLEQIRVAARQKVEGAFDRAVCSRQLIDIWQTGMTNASK